MNVAVNKRNLGAMYLERAERAENAGDLNQCVTKLELSLSNYREAARIFTAIQHFGKAVEVSQSGDAVEKKLSHVALIRAVTPSRG